MKRFGAFLLASATLLRAEPLQAFTWYLTNDFLFQRNDLATKEAGPGGASLGRDKSPNEFLESLSLLGNMRTGKRGELSAGVTLRSTNFYKQDQNLVLAERQDSVHRAFAKYRTGGLELQAGDFYALLGQGLVVSVLQNDVLLRERAIRGGEARWRTRRFEARALGGTVATEIQTEGQRQEWSLAAAEASLDLYKGNRVGLRGARVEDETSPAFGERVGRRDTQSISLSGSNLWGRLSYYGEYGRLFYRDPKDLALGRKAGDALYGNLSLHAGKLLLLAEHKKYQRFDNGLNNLPLADREEEVNDLAYQKGSRLYAQYHLQAPDLSLFASAGHYSEGPWLPAQGRASGPHVYGGFAAQDLWGRLSASYTYGERRVGYPVKRTSASSTLQFAGEWSVQCTFKDKRFRRSDFAFHEQDLNTQLAKASWGALWVQKQHSREPVPELAGRRDFWSGGVRANLTRGAWVEVSMGNLRGGEVCSGGQCLRLPPFKGWKVSTHFALK